MPLWGPAARAVGKAAMGGNCGCGMPEDAGVGPAPSPASPGDGVEKALLCLDGVWGRICCLFFFFKLLFFFPDVLAPGPWVTCPGTASRGDITGLGRCRKEKAVSLTLPSTNSNVSEAFLGLFWIIFFLIINFLSLWLRQIDRCFIYFQL